MNSKLRWLMLVAALGFGAPLLPATEKSQFVSAIFSDMFPRDALLLYEKYAGEPIALDAAVKASKSPVSFSFKNVEKETALKLIAEALRTQAGISIERDAGGKLKAVIVPKSPVSPKP